METTIRYHQINRHICIEDIFLDLNTGHVINLKSSLYLTAVGVRSCIGHADGEGSVVPQLWTNFILEFSSPDGLASGANSSWITSLDHELLYYLQLGNRETIIIQAISSCVPTLCSVL